MATHWSYAGDDGPEHWADLSEAFGSCGGGTEQSPIDLADPTLSEGHRVDWTYAEAALEVSYNQNVIDLIDNGHTIQISYPGGSLLHLVDGDYELAQFHFHAPSEHTLNGQHYPIEIHLVHQAANGRIAVIGVLVEPGEKHKVLALLAKNLPQAPGESLHLENRIIDVGDMVLRGERYFTYDGSLTTPPCSEGVQWFVMETPLRAAVDDIEAIAGLLHGNNRPLQALGDRVLEIVKHRLDDRSPVQMSRRRWRRRRIARAPR